MIELVPTSKPPGQDSDDRNMPETYEALGVLLRYIQKHTLPLNPGK